LPVVADFHTGPVASDQRMPLCRGAFAGRLA
jgi:hypothetical protein